VHNCNSCTQKTTWCHLLFLFHFLYVQNVSDINISIIRSLRLFCWITTLVVCSWFDVCWCFGVAGLEWYPCWRLKPATRIPLFYFSAFTRIAFVVCRFSVHFIQLSSLQRFWQSLLLQSEVLDYQYFLFTINICGLDIWYCKGRNWCSGGKMVTDLREWLIPLYYWLYKITKAGLFISTNLSFNPNPVYWFIKCIWYFYILHKIHFIFLHKTAIMSLFYVTICISEFYTILDIFYAVPIWSYCLYGFSGLYCTLDILHVRSTYKFDSLYISVNVFHFVNMDHICYMNNFLYGCRMTVEVFDIIFMFVYSKCSTFYLPILTYTNMLSTFFSFQCEPAYCFSSRAFPF